MILQACVSEEAEKQEKASNKSKSLYERAVESADHEKVEQVDPKEHCSVSPCVYVRVYHLGLGID